MSRKKLILIGLVIVILLYIAVSASRTISNSKPVNVRNSESTSGGVASQLGMGMPSFTRDESTSIAPDISVPPPSGPAVDSGRNIIQTSSMSLIVQNVEQSTQEIEQMAKSRDGFIANSSLNSYQSSKQITSASLQVRIPQDKLNEFHEALKSHAVQVKSISTNSDDVTTQVRDLQSEIDNLRKQEEQLRVFFERTTNITQLLEVEREVNRVRTQIDQKQGQLNYYERASALATVTIHLALDEAQLPATPTERFQPQAVWNAAVATLLSVLHDLAYLGIYAAVFSVLWIPAVIMYAIIRKKYTRK